MRNAVSCWEYAPDFFSAFRSRDELKPEVAATGPRAAHVGDVRGALVWVRDGDRFVGQPVEICTAHQAGCGLCNSSLEGTTRRFLSAVDINVVLDHHGVAKHDLVESYLRSTYEEAARLIADYGPFTGTELTTMPANYQALVAR